MKKIILVLSAFICTMAMSQSVAYIEIKEIISKMPEYQKANELIEAQVTEWEDEVELRFQNVENLYQEYVKNEMIYSEDVKQQKQEEIVQSEKQAKEFREQKFGKEGELKKLKEQKIKPLQENIFKAAEKVALANGYDYVFDKSPESNWIFVKPEHNLTEKVLLELGIKPE